MSSTALRVFIAALVPLGVTGVALELGAGSFSAIALGAGVAALTSRRVAASTLAPLRRLEVGVDQLRRRDRLQPAAPSRSTDIAQITAAVERDARQLRTDLDEATTDKEQLEAVLSAMAEGVLILDANGRIALANRSLRKFFDSWADAAGRRPVEVIRHAQLDALLAAAVKSETPRTAELEHVGPKDRTLLVHASRVPPSGERTGTVAVFHDVSEIRALDKVRRDFVANASHELRTPLTSIRGFAETLASAPGTPDDLAGPLDAILRNSRRLGSLIDDLLALSRIEAQRDPIGRTDVDLTLICRMLLDDSAPRLRDQNMQAQLDAPPVAIALADASAVERILSNLLDNAIQYTDAGGKISVRLAIEADSVCVAIEDSGMGIPPGDLERIFERFYRVDDARSRALGGTGLGLSIVKHLVHALHGEVWVESTLGEGSTFSVRLPRPPARDSTSN